MLEKNEILRIFRETGALQQGHFGLTSGLHSDTYFQCALVLQYPQYAAQLCEAGKEHFAAEAVDCVVAPAVGGIVVGYELARQLNCRSLFAERQQGRMTLRRGFAIRPGERVVIAEDVVTTGGSVAEVIALAATSGAAVLGVFAVVDRSGGSVDFGVPFHAAVQLSAQTFAPGECPLCRDGVPMSKPGSRELQR